MNELRIYNDIIQERVNQVTDHGYDQEHDDQHDPDTLALGAAHYVMPERPDWEPAYRIWPFEDEFDNKRNHSRYRQLMIAAAFCVAAARRLVREGDVMKPFYNHISPLLQKRDRGYNFQEDTILPKHRQSMHRRFDIDQYKRIPKDNCPNLWTLGHYYERHEKQMEEGYGLSLYAWLNRVLKKAWDEGESGCYELIKGLLNDLNGMVSNYEFVREDIRLKKEWLREYLTRMEEK